MNMQVVAPHHVFTYCALALFALLGGCRCPASDRLIILESGVMTTDGVISSYGQPDQIVEKGDLSRHDLDVWNSHTLDGPDAQTCYLYRADLSGAHYYYFDSKGVLLFLIEISAKSYGPWPN